MGAKWTLAEAYNLCGADPKSESQRSARRPDCRMRSQHARNHPRRVSRPAAARPDKELTAPRLFQTAPGATVRRNKYRRLRPLHQVQSAGHDANADKPDFLANRTAS